jgi:protein O-mannosyl-transferase
MSFPSHIKKQTWLWLWGVLAITALVYSGALGHQFLSWDDPQFLVNNFAVRDLSLKNLRQIFVTTTESVYVPLTILSYALEYHFFKMSPMVYHFNNVLLHVAVTGLLFAFALLLGVSRRAAFLAALLFGIHPMHVESVAWITERKDVLYAFLYLLSLTCYWKYLNLNKMFFYFLSILAGLCSMLAKPMALSLPLILWLCDWLHGRGMTKTVFFDKLPYFLFSVPIGLITYLGYRRLPGQDGLEGILIWIWTFSFYLQKFVWPAVLTPFYQLPKPISLFSLPYLLAIVTFCGVVGSVLFYRRQKWLVFAVGYYFCSIFFLLRFDTVADRNIVADRFMYLPSLGFCLWGGVVLDQLLKRHQKNRGKYLAMATSGILFALLSWKTIVQVNVWKDNSSLWDYVIRYSPTSATAFNHRGLMYQAQGDIDAAFADYERAIALDPEFQEAYNNRGLIYTKRKKYELARNDYTMALRLSPREAKIFFNRGMLHFWHKKYVLAMKDLNRAIEIQPNFADAYNGRGTVFEANKQFPQAIQDYNRAILLNPYYSEAYNNRAVVYGKQKMYRFAFEDFAKAIETNPENSTAFFNRSLTYLDIGEYDQALADAQKAKALGHSLITNYLEYLQSKRSSIIK